MHSESYMQKTKRAAPSGVRGSPGVRWRFYRRSAHSDANDASDEWVTWRRVLLELRIEATRRESEA